MALGTFYPSIPRPDHFFILQYLTINLLLQCLLLGHQDEWKNPLLQHHLGGTGGKAAHHNLAAAHGK